MFMVLHCSEMMYDAIAQNEEVSDMIISLPKLMNKYMLWVNKKYWSDDYVNHIHIYVANNSVNILEHAFKIYVFLLIC